MRSCGIRLKYALRLKYTLNFIRVLTVQYKATYLVWQILSDSNYLQTVVLCMRTFERLRQICELLEDMQ